MTEAADHRHRRRLRLRQVHGRANVAQALGAGSVAFIDMDAYYRNFAHLPMEERRKVNWDHPDAFDWDLLIDHLARLSRGEAIDKPVYDFVTHTRQHGDRRASRRRTSSSSTASCCSRTRACASSAT